MSVLDLLTTLSYIALNVDVIFQMARVLKTKSSRDISLIGLGIRYAAIIVILIKFVGLSDLPLIFGQGLIFVTISLYLVLVVIYRLQKTR